MFSKLKTIEIQKIQLQRRESVPLMGICGHHTIHWKTARTITSVSLTDPASIYSHTVLRWLSYSSYSHILFSLRLPWLLKLAVRKHIYDSCGVLYREGTVLNASKRRS